MRRAGKVDISTEPTELMFEVIGEPAPQGSKRHVGKGILIESSKKVKPWREAVVWAARDAMWSEFKAFDGPISVKIIFSLKRPASAPKSVRLPWRKPDLDKLVRSTLDAIVLAGIIADDARVVEIEASKRFAGGDWGLVQGVPGARIWVKRINEARKAGAL